MPGHPSFSLPRWSIGLRDSASRCEAAGLLLGTVTAAMAVTTSAGPDAAKQLQTIASDAVVQSACGNGTANNGFTPRDCAKEK